jgi:hypothetical protein
MLDGQGKSVDHRFWLGSHRANQSLTITGDLLGALRYIGPEQAAGQASPCRSAQRHLFAGRDLYELLTLQPVIAGDDRAAADSADRFC